MTVHVNLQGFMLDVHDYEKTRVAETRRLFSVPDVFSHSPGNFG